MPPQTTGALAWEAPTHIAAERSADWYWALGLLSVGGIAASIWWQNYLFGIIIFLGAVIIATLAAREPRRHAIELSAQGVRIDHESYPYAAIHAFWIEVEGHPMPKLYFATASIIHPHLMLVIEPPLNPQAVREFLLRFLPEEEKHSIGTIAAEFLGL